MIVLRPFNNARRESLENNQRHKTRFEKVGTYTLLIDATGFAKYERKGITLHTSDRINVPDITLGLAAVAQEVQVSATPDVVVPVDSGEKSQVILAKQMQNLSIVGRSAVELLKILPGVVYRSTNG